MPDIFSAVTRHRARLNGLGLVMASGLAGSAAMAQDAPFVPSHNLFGVPGLVDMPTGEVDPDATIAATMAQIGDTRRTTISFQITPRLSGTFRYSGIGSFRHPDSVNGVFYDRSFDLRYQLLKEGDIMPSVVVGFQDLIGTGLYGGEYLVATKSVAPGLKLTGGLGWGRLGSYNSFGTTGTRPNVVLGRGGVPTYDRWFRGPVAGFGGLSYAPNANWNFSLEYSSDNYNIETARGNMSKDSPWNFGIDYRFRSGSQLSLYHFNGNEVGAQFTLVMNPKTFGVGGGIEQASFPVKVRPAGSASDLGWIGNTAVIDSANQELRALAAKDGLHVEGLTLEANRATVRLVNPRYGAPSQAIGRTARAMSRTLPASVEEFVIVPVESGMAMSAVVMRRSDLERLEHEGAEQMLARTSIVDAYGRLPELDPGLYPKFSWAFGPYAAISLFDPDNPLGLEVGLRANADWQVAPNIILSGAVTKELGNNSGDKIRVDKSNLPRVRTDRAQYATQGDPAIKYLQVAMYGRPGRNLYSRLTLGYLESMYAGASGEVLWKPVNSRFALGAELNYVMRRDYDQLFGLQSMTTTDPVTGIKRDIPNLNGHLSAYYSFGNGFHGQLDVGRYLAGDYGATIALDREFANGWRIGAYATKTNASFEDFGEGSFDKGLRFTIPIASFIGTPTRKNDSFTLQSLTRDGGARLSVRGRLYDQVRDYHEPDVVNSWGRFWR
ncbi:YjbH domain-containing protein [Tropicibacter oceani]|uniref:YjbH domain-containing protein n=1 Tax=Tropicibacter oceani TaxID=3058420 RepID=A0ABY8QJE1_9RHOB|nr:YjbH domain-containing protein [Tropicibacter oceani]WGW04630.1 YjbH domain-containing protein [Tropicibacter oceani]